MNISITAARKEWAFDYNTDGTYTITGYKGDAMSAIVPSMIGSNYVSCVANDAFSPEALYIHESTREKRRRLEEIVIPSGILCEPTIDDIPKGIKRLSCPDKTIFSIFMPGSTVRGRRCYVQGLYLRDLEEIVPVDLDSAYLFEKGLFYNAEKTELYFRLCAVPLDDLIIPGTVQKISGGAFSGGSFGIITIPDSVLEIGHSAFYACKADKLIIGGGISEPSTDIFGWSIISSMPHRMSFKEIEFKEGITRIPQCFGKLKELKKVTLPQSLTFIPDKCFYYRPDIKTQFFDYLERGEAKEMVFNVIAGSFAEKYAKENGYAIEYHT